MCTCFIPNDAETLNLPSSIENRIWKFQTILTYEEVATGNKTLKTKKKEENARQLWVKMLLIQHFIY